MTDAHDRWLDAAEECWLASFSLPGGLSSERTPHSHATDDYAMWLLGELIDRHRPGHAERVAHHLGCDADDLAGCWPDSEGRPA